MCERTITDADRPTRDDPGNNPREGLGKDSAETREFIRRHNAATMETYGGEELNKRRAALQAALDRKDKLATGERVGDSVYNFWRDDKHPRGIYQSTPYSLYASGKPEWTTRFDLDKHARATGKNFLWQGCDFSPAPHKRAIFSVTDGGTTECQLWEFDLDTNQLVDGVDGFNIREAGQSFPSWYDVDTLLVASTVGPEMAAQSGYPRTVRAWRRGEQFSTAPIIFQRDGEQYKCVYGAATGSAADRRVLFTASPNFNDEERHIGGLKGPEWTLSVPPDAKISTKGDLLLVQPKSKWQLGDREYPVDSVVALSLAQAEQASKSNDFSQVDSQLLLVSDEQTVVDGVDIAAGRAVIQVYTDAVQDVYLYMRADNGEWIKSMIPNLARTGAIEIKVIDKEGSEDAGTLQIITTDPVTPPTLMLYDLATAQPPSIVQRGSTVSDSKGLTVQSYEARAKNGDRIPYHWTGPEKMSGPIPVAITCYGGFGDSVKAEYDEAVSLLLLKTGWSHVSVHTHGGCERGTGWQKAAEGPGGKSIVVADVATVANDIHERGLSSPGKTAFYGPSLTGMIGTLLWEKHPELFSGIWADCPLTDMYTYHERGAGQWWTSELGNPPSDWPKMKDTSPLHGPLPEPTEWRPPLLVTTSADDNLVDPAHGRMFVDKFDLPWTSCYFYESKAGGHRTRDHDSKSLKCSLGFSFLAAAVKQRAELM